MVRAVVVMFLSRLGSLNAVEESASSAFWRRWLGCPLPSADTMGRVAQGMDLQQLREVQQQIYTRLKRGKALAPRAHGMILAAVDGHESTASYLRCCPQCLERTIHTRQGDRIQYYHRHVTLTLIAQDLVIPLDLEPQGKGEGEVAAVRRLLNRCLARYPRAFDVVLADSLYADGDFINEVVDHGKGCIVVLKNDRRDLHQDVMGLCGHLQPQPFRWRNRQCAFWDLQDLTTYPQVKHPMRVIRNMETWSVKRQLTGKEEPQHSDWIWMVVMPPGRQLPAPVAIDMGHSRWDIENQTFNELRTRWHADHVYCHEPQAIAVFSLLAMICLTVFLAFYRRNLKPRFQQAHSMLAVARRIMAQLLHIPGSGAPETRARAP